MECQDALQKEKRIKGILLRLLGPYQILSETYRCVLPQTCRMSTDMCSKSELTLYTSRGINELLSVSHLFVNFS